MNQRQRIKMDTFKGEKTRPLQRNLDHR